MSLLAFPNEITLRIISYIHLSTIVSFALTCKTLHQVSCAALRRHASLKSQYSVLCFGTDDYDANDIWKQRIGNQIHPLVFLDRLLESPIELAYYPTELQLEPTHSRDPNNDEDEKPGVLKDEILRILNVRRSEISQLVLDCPFIASDHRENWCLLLSHVERLSVDAFIGIIVSLLPNLQSITILDVSYRIERFRELVTAIAIANQDSTSEGHGKALTNLTECAVDRTDTEMGEDFTLYAPFAALPAMRSLHGNMIDGEDFTYLGEPWDAKSRIEEIKIGNSAISSSAFTSLLERIESLERFTYHHAGSIVGSGRYEVTGMMNALREHASHSLQQLDLTADQDSLVGDDEDEQWIGSLKCFQKLRVIRVDDNVFQKPIPESQFDGALDEGFCHEEVARVVDVLPASVRVLKLAPEMKSEHAKKLWNGFVEEREEKLPELRKIVWEGRCPLGMATREQFKDLGIVLKNSQQNL